MNSITGFSVLKKPFSWKFSKYSKFSKKMKLHLNEKEGSNKDSWEEGSPSPSNSLKENSQESTSFSWDFSERWPSSEEDERFSWDDEDDSVYSTPSSSPQQRSVDEDTYPLYENGDLVGLSGCIKREVEPIYESVSITRSPANLFSSLVGSQETVSPDPNIYEVPPGAILNISGLPEDSPKNITPPNGFKDDQDIRTRRGLEELCPKLEDLYSTVIKPRAKMEVAVYEKTDEAFVNDIVPRSESPLTEGDEYASASESEEYSMPDYKDAEDQVDKSNGPLDIEQCETAQNVPVTPKHDVNESALVEDDESLATMEVERRRIIDNQVVKKKRVDSWIKESGMSSDVEDTDLTEESNQTIIAGHESGTDDQVDANVTLQTNFPIFCNDSLPVDEVVDQSELEGEIVYDSILQNKEKTKNYWEKLMLATKMAASSRKKAGVDESAGKVESVVEREIRLQREREEALVLERQKAFKLAKYAEEGLHSIPTTDEGNYSECSEEKDQSLDSSGETEAVFNYQRTPSFESMSSGHSSGSDSAIKQKANCKNLEETRSEQIHKIQKESPVEKDSKITTAREDDTYVKSKIQETLKKNINKVDEIRAELESISLKKCVSMSNLPLTPNAESNNSSQTSKSGLGNKFRNTNSRQKLSNDTNTKLFTPSKIPRGLMKRFIDSHGRLPTSFVLAPPQPVNTTPAPKKVQVPTETVDSPKTPKRSQESSAPLRRPGYRSAEDKIQMELKEMKRREAELKQDRARLLGRSQPNLQNIGLDDLYSDEESCSLPQMGKLRSALSNPNLTNERTVIIPKRCNELIDAWENMIQKKAED